MITVFSSSYSGVVFLFPASLIEHIIQSKLKKPGVASWISVENVLPGSTRAHVLASQVQFTSLLAKVPDLRGVRLRQWGWIWDSLLPPQSACSIALGSSSDTLCELPGLTFQKLWLV